MEDKRYAVLIDAENISAKYISYILDEVSRYGVITYKRIYGDWTSSYAVRWKKELMENSIMPIQQFSNTIGKNATDSALIIDAMDILYTGNVDGFCIVSSDSDFTRLASRLRESGMDVVGMGENKTPRSFRAACTVFTNLELLMSADTSDNVLTTQNTDMSLKEMNIDRETIEKYISTIISENDNKERETDLAEMGNRLLKKYPDFDVRNYGYSSLSKFLEEMDSVELIKNPFNNKIVVKIKKLPRKELEAFILETVNKQGKRGLDLCTLGQKVHAVYPNFDVKDYGYATFVKMMQSIKGIKISDEGTKGKVAYGKI